MTQSMQPMQGMMPNQAAAQPTQFQYAQGQDPSAPAQMMAPGMAPGMAQGMPQGMAPGAAPGNPSVPNGGMLYITAPAAEPEPTENTGNGEPSDPRIYRPRVTKKNKTYTATVRPLPNGTNFASYPYVCVKVHYIRDLVTGKLLIAKCCQNPTKTPDGKIIPGVDKFSCPYCQDVWNRRKAAKEAGADEKTLQKYLQMLPEDIWYGNALIISDENHNELAGQVKLWEMNKFQHNTLQEPVTEYNKRAEAIKEGKQYFDKGNCFIPYDPVQGRNYQIAGVWDEKKSMGPGGKKGAPTYQGSGFAGYSSMLATKTVTNPHTGMQEVVFDENQMYDILQRCYDLTIVYEDTPTPEQARATLAKFWQEVNAEIARKQQSAAAGNFGLGAPQMPGAASPYNQTYAAQPFPTGAQGYMPQGNIPNVPPTTKVQTGLSFGQVPNTPATTAYSPTPAVMRTPVNPSQPGNIQPAVAAPQFAQPTAPAAPTAPTFAASAPASAQAAPQFAQPGVQAAAPAAPQFTAPTAAQFTPQGVQMGAPAAAPGAPAAEPYRPAPAPAPAPATPVFQVPSQGASPSAPVQQQAAPAQQQVTTYETDDDETLPF